MSRALLQTLLAPLDSLSFFFASEPHFFNGTHATYELDLGDLASPAALSGLVISDAVSNTASYTLADMIALQHRTPTVGEGGGGRKNEKGDWSAAPKCSNPFWVCVFFTASDLMLLLIQSAKQRRRFIRCGNAVGPRP